MFEELKYLPLVQWIKWIIQSSQLKRANPTLSIGYNSQVVGCSFGHRNIVYGNTTLIKSTFGDYTYVGGHVKIQCARIGQYCSIAEGVKIGLGIHPLHLKSTHPAFYSSQSHWKDEITPTLIEGFEEYKEIIVGDDVWIGTNAMIMDGVTIGNHVVIAAGAVVTKNVPDYAIVGGVPARVIKYRNNE